MHACMQVEALQKTLAQHQELQRATGPARDTAMLAAYRGFLQLVMAEEEAATQPVVRVYVAVQYMCACGCILK